MSDQISVPSQIIGITNTTDYWLGYFGLGIKPTNFTYFQKKTFLASMVENQSLIPSHSYGYTAGAYYREEFKFTHLIEKMLIRAGLKSVPASLTIGGYDANRFEPHDTSFSLNPNQDPEVSVNQISVTAAPLVTSTVQTGWSDNSITLLEPADAALYIIDSSTPYLWLPDVICDRFEKALGLTYDDDVQLYTFRNNLSRHETLVNWNLTFTFVIADLPGSPNSVSLSLPYAAFDLQLSYPYPGLNATSSSTPTKYFPLRKAANNTQYTLGRAFLQETFLMVDFERNNFSVYQAKFNADALTNFDLVDIKRSENTTFSGPNIPSRKSLGKGAIAGIAVGAAVGVAAAIGAVVCCICLRQRPSKTSSKAETIHGTKKKPLLSKLSKWLLCSSKSDLPVEVPGSHGYPNEAPTDGAKFELPSPPPAELPGHEIELSPYQVADRKFREAPPNHDPKDPTAVGYYAPELPSQPSPRLLPPYSANHVGRRNTQTTGVSSRSVQTSRDSSAVSSPMLISPLTPNQASPMMLSMAHIARRDQWPFPNESGRSSLSDAGTGYGDEQPITPRSLGGSGLHDRSPG